MDNKLNFKSQIHRISNYNFRFTRFNRTRAERIDDFINQIDIMTLDNINLYTIKFNTYNADILLMVLKLLYGEGEPFEYDIPSFNMSEVFKINGKLEFVNYDTEVKIYLKITRETTDGNISDLDISFSPEEFENFMFLFYFMFLIDLMDGSSY